jgi:hypothetical protein
MMIAYTTVKFGIDCLLEEPELCTQLAERGLALLAGPASTIANLVRLRANLPVNGSRTASL